jgi:hypothetical protein
MMRRISHVCNGIRMGGTNRRQSRFKVRRKMYHRVHIHLPIIVFIMMYLHRSVDPKGKEDYCKSMCSKSNLYCPTES